MFSIPVQALLGVFIVSLMSFIGIFTISIHPNKLKDFLIYLVSFAAGSLFGGAFIHLLPKSVRKAGGFTIEVSMYALSGIVIMFLVEKVIQWRHCHHPVEIEDGDEIRPVAMMNLIGDGVHNFLDGLIIGASFLIGTETGIAATLAVLLHEIPQEIGDFGVLMHGGFSRLKALFVNFLTALTSVLGASIAIILSSYTENISTIIIPFAVGNFVYIAGSDLIPELHNCGDEDSIVKSTLQLLTFMAGIGVMWLILIINTVYIK